MNAFGTRVAVVCLVLGASWTTGCGLFQKDASSPYSANYLFFSLGEPVTDGPARAPFQNRFMPDTFIFDLSDGSPEFLCEHDRIGTQRKREENDIPSPTICKPDVTIHIDPPPPPVMHTGPDGTNLTPEGYQHWSGGMTGGCGTWATAMCERILHHTDPSSQVTMSEWERIATAIHQDASGGSLMEDRTKYFQALGYCVVDKRFDGSAADYAEARMHYERNCDLKVSMWRRHADGEYSDGHVETVTRVNADDSLVTNSWGQAGTIRGGSTGHFAHTRADGTRFLADDGSVAWPESESEVWMSYICPCGDFEALGNLLLEAADAMRNP